MILKKWPWILALILPIVGISAIFPILHSCSSHNINSNISNNLDNENNDYTINLKATKFDVLEDVIIEDIDQVWIKQYVIDNKDVFFTISGNLSNDELKDAIEISNLKKENNSVTFDLVIKDKNQLIHKITFNKKENPPTNQPSLDDIIDSFAIEPKQSVVLSQIFASEVNKDNLSNYFNINYQKDENLSIEYKIVVDKTDSSKLNIVVSFTKNGETKQKQYSFTGFKIIELKQESFDANLFGWSNSLAEDIKDDITSDWIIQNQDKLFNIEGNFKKEDITIDPHCEPNNTKREVNVIFQVKNDKIIEFKIINFKEEEVFDNKYEQLVEQIVDLIDIVSSDDVYFDYKKISVDKFVSLDYEIQKKFFNFNWNILDEEFKDNDLWKSETNPNGETEIKYVPAKSERPNTVKFTIEIYVGDEEETTKVIERDGFLSESNVDETSLSDFINKFEAKFQLVQNKPNYDHHTINVQKFLALPSNEQEQYFNWNYDDLKATFPNFDNHCLFTFNVKDGFKFDQSRPTTIDFDVYLIVAQSLDNDLNPQNILAIKQKEISIDDFDMIFEPIVGLDAAKEEKLITPSQATSYKGKLARFRFKDIKETTNNAYQDLIKNMTWDDFKKEMAYQVRFALYQMFSDNFSEINYYISNDIEHKQLTATAVGLIKESKNNVNYYFQYLGNTKNQTTSVNKEDKIEISITYDVNNSNNWKPTYTDDSGLLPGLNLNFWNFKDNCQNLNTPSDPYYLSPTFINLISGNIHLSIKSIATTITSLYDDDVKQFAFWSFNWLKTRPKNI